MLENIPLGNLVLATALSCYMLIAFLSLFYAARRLKRPGVSTEVRDLFFRKHKLYVVVFIIIWTVQLSQNYYSLFNPQLMNGNIVREHNPMDLFAQTIGL